MTTQALYIKLRDQIARQQPELAAYDADIAARTPGVQALADAVAAAEASQQAADAAVQARRQAIAQAEAVAQAARIALADEGASEEARAAAQAALNQALDDAESAAHHLPAEEAAAQTAAAALQSAREAHAGPRAELDDVTARADAIRAAIAQCQADLAATGLSLTDDQITAARLADVRTAALRRIDADTDAIYGAVIGNRATEYADAEAHAAAYQAAGFAGTVPAHVAAWAAAKGWTPQAAAEDILATAATWRGAQASIRAQRLARKEAVRHAADAAAVESALAQWRTFAAQMRAALGA